MENMTIEQMRELLRTNVVEVHFTKADGSTRVMLASTNPMYIPDYDPEAEPNNPWSDEVLRVMDTELGEWRSFRLDSVQNFFVTNMPVLQEYVEVVA